MDLKDEKVSITPAFFLLCHGCSNLLVHCLLVYTDMSGFQINNDLGRAQVCRRMPLLTYFMKSEAQK